MDRRLWIVFGVGLAIAAACYFRLRVNRPYDYDAQVRAASIAQPAPLFEGVDENNEIFRLSAYLGRHRIIVAFYDGAAGADRSLDLRAIRDRADDLKRRDVKVVAVSQAIPQENRAALKGLEAFPGPLVSDIDGSIHQNWGRMSPDGKPLTGLFLIDRKGTVAHYAGAPRPYDDFDSLWKDIATQ
jgi:peroxiredoxin